MFYYFQYQVKCLKVISFLIFFFCFGGGVGAQVCGFDALLNNHPELNAAFDASFLKKNKKEPENPSITYVIPVVFHILYDEENKNLHDSVIFNQLDLINKIYSECNAPIRSVFEEVVACPKFKFQMANTTPNGQLTNGINRVQTQEKTFFHSDAIFIYDNPKYAEFGGTNAWNTDKYLNIWICNLRPLSGGGGLLGYAFPPVESPLWNRVFYVSKERQGVVMHYQAIGNNNPVGNANWSHVLAHEIGHYLGLKHTWGDEENRCDLNDFIEDTPPCKNASNFCDFSKNTCDEGILDKPDMIENIMDYAPARCLTHFTQGQVNRMRANLVQYRPYVYETYLEDSAYLGLFVWPNPNNGKFSMALGQSNGESVRTVEIFDSHGKRIWMEEISNNATFYEVDLRPLRRGFYFVWMHSLQYSFYSKMVVY